MSRSQLRALEDAGFVERDDDMLRQRRPLYRLVDPIVRFHHVVTRPDLARFEDRRFADAWPDAAARFSTHVLGPHFEWMAREFTRRYSSPATTGGQAAKVGPAVINDPKGRTQHELDVVAMARLGTGASSVIAIGEAKHTNRPRATGDLDRLERIRGLLVDRGDASTETKLLLFSANGFDRNLSRLEGDRSDVELIDLERLYKGS